MFVVVFYNVLQEGTKIFKHVYAYGLRVATFREVLTFTGDSNLVGDLDLHDVRNVVPVTVLDEVLSLVGDLNRRQGVPSDLGTLVP